MAKQGFRDIYRAYCEQPAVSFDERSNRLHIAGRKSSLIVTLWPYPSAWSRSNPSEEWNSSKPRIDLSLGAAEETVAAWLYTCHQHCPDYFTGQRFISEFPLPNPVEGLRRARRNLEAYRRAAAMVPERVRTSVVAYPERHFELLTLIWSNPETLDLIESTPALAQMMANAMCFRGESLAGSDEFPPVAKPQIVLLEWLGFASPSKSTVRMLRKLPVSQCSVESLLQFRAATDCPEIREMFRHLHQINRSAIEFVSDPNLKQLATPELLQFMSGDKGEQFGRHCLACLKHLERLHRAAGLGNLSYTTTELREMLNRDALSDTPMHEVFMPQGLGEVFPPPPIPSSTYVRPIPSLAALILDGIEQRHCVAKYAPAIRGRNYYAYSVRHAGSRATLMVTNIGDTSNPEWVPGQLRGKGNSRPRAHILSVVNRWLRSNAREFGVKNLGCLG